MEDIEWERKDRLKWIAEVAKWQLKCDETEHQLTESRLLVAKLQGEILLLNHQLDQLDTEIKDSHGGCGSPELAEAAGKAIAAKLDKDIMEGT
jgi:hypothetical protein